MKYICLIFVDESKLNAWPHKDRTFCESTQRAYEEMLKQRGHLLLAEALAPTGSAVTVRNETGQTRIASGPHAQMTEALAAVYVITARDLNEAIRVAAGMPWARIGGVEVRPVRVPDDDSFIEPRNGDCP